MTDETPTTKTSPPKSKFHLNMNVKLLAGVGIVLVTWVVLGAVGWFMYQQNSGLRRQLATLQTGQAGSTGNKAEVEPLLQRINELEGQISELSAQPAQEPVEESAGVVQEADALPEETIPVPPVTNNDVSALQTQLTQTQQALAQLQEARDASAGLVAAISLREGVNSGHSYAEELAAIAMIAKEDKTLQGYVGKLLPYAEGGIGKEETLKTSFETIISNALKASKVNNADNSALRWAKEQLSNVVQIRRVGSDVEGESLEAILARAESFVQQGDFINALNELKPVEGKPVEVLQPWVDKVQVYLTSKNAANGMYRYMLSKTYRPKG